jgi:hypothetical protein
MVVFMVAASRWFWAGLTRVFFDPCPALRAMELEGLAMVESVG